MSKVFWDKQLQRWAFATSITLHHYRLLNLIRADTSKVQQASRKKEGKSKYKGVFWEIAAGKWRAQTTCKTKKYHLGTFNAEKKAALAYDKAALELFGEYARTNQIIYPEDFK